MPAVPPVLAFMNDDWVALQQAPCRDVDEYSAPTGDEEFFQQRSAT
jgi:hypothetical protein